MTVNFLGSMTSSVTPKMLRTLIRLALIVLPSPRASPRDPRSPRRCTTGRSCHRPARTRGRRRIEVHRSQGSSGNGSYPALPFVPFAHARELPFAQDVPARVLHDLREPDAPARHQESLQVVPAVPAHCRSVGVGDRVPRADALAAEDARLESVSIYRAALL